MTAVEWERRWARPVAITSIVAAMLLLVSIVVELSLTDAKDDATQLTSFHDHSTELLGAAILLAIGSLLLAAPLYYLFRAAQARNEAVRGPMVAFAFIGPVLVAARSIVSWIASNDVAGKFIDGSDHSADAAKALIDNSSVFDVASALSFPAALGLLIAMIYIPLQAMRVGLLTRFWGTLGMALGGSLIFIGFLAFIGLVIWFLYVGLMIGGWLRSGRPPAWETGEAIPWPVPERRGAGGAVVEGDGREINVGPKEAMEPELPAPAAGDEDLDDLGETQGQRRKKRKRRD